MQNTPNAANAQDIIKQLIQARELAFSSKDVFPQVLRQVLQFASNPDVNIQRWCATFMKECFESDESKVDVGVKVDLAIDALDPLITLCNIQDVQVLKNCIDASIVVFRLVFRYVADNDGCGPVWSKLNELKNLLTSKFSTTYPYPASDDEEKDFYRGIDVKTQLLKFVILVIDHISKSSSSDSYSLSFVPSNHSLIRQSIEAEAHGLLDSVLSVFNIDIMVTPLITASLFQLSLIAKRKPQFLSKILRTIENFDSTQKLQSNYETIEQYKLSRKFVDRSLKIFLHHLLRNQIIPPNASSAFSKRVSLLISRGDDIRKKNILLPSPDDSRINKRKFDGFVNSSKKLKTNDYKSLYCLTDVSNDLNNFDLSTLPQNILIAMSLTALKKVRVAKLMKGLDIVKERYNYALENFGNSSEIKKENFGEDDEDENDNEYYSPEENYTLPPPKELTVDQKRDHISLIVKNFFKLAERDLGNTESVQDFADNGSPVSKELTRIAIKTWKKDSWLIVLSRLATRGMRSTNASDLATDQIGTPNPETTLQNSMSDIIRQAIFDYFLENIHGRIDFIIDWLNEEWYSEKVFNEEVLRRQLVEKYTSEYESSKPDSSNIDQKVQAEMDVAVISTPTYNLWTGKVLDSLIPFLQPTDRKIFIRLLSDLPYLDSNLVSRIKSLCYDPGRIKIGFLALQFLIMYRPPVRSACISILEELSKNEQEDLKDEATKLLAKYNS